METTDQQGDLMAPPKYLKGEIKNENDPTVYLKSQTQEDMILTFSVKSEPDLSPSVSTHTLLSSGDYCCPNNLDIGHDLFELKSEVKSEVTTDDCMARELKETTADPFQDCVMSKVKIDDTEEECDSNTDSQDHSGTSLNAPQETKPHTKNLREHLCSVCGKSHNSAQALRTHMNTHNGEKSFVCPTCGKAFANKCYMNTHIRVHTGERPYVCHLCGKAFPRSDSLTNHMRIHTGEKKEVLRKHSCDICGHSFAKLSKLLYHQQRHTENRPFICKECHKGFKVLTDLRDHQKSHVDVKPHVCIKCGHGFSRLYCLDKHYRTHTKQKPYSCPHCPKQYGYRQSLTYHMKCHSNISQ